MCFTFEDLVALLSFQFMASGEVSFVPLVVLKPVASRLKLIFLFATLRLK